MKTILAFSLFCIAILVIACNSGGETKKVSKEQAIADSLWHSIDEGHIAGMKVMGRLNRTQNETRRLLDSLDKLPAKARQAAVHYKTGLDSLLQKLDYADFAMNKWMGEFQFEVEKIYPDIQERIRYLTLENEKVIKMKEAILGSLARADSIYKRAL